MNAPTHRLVAAATVAAAGTHWGVPLEHAAVALPVAWLAATLPDRSERWVPGPHRGPTHWLAANVAVTALVYLAATVVAGATAAGVIAAGVAAGCLSHLAIDGLNNHPIAYLAPVIWTRFALLPRPLRIPVGGVAEHIFAATIVLATGVYLGGAHGVL